MNNTLVIGYGNTLRGDDGAGVRAAVMASEQFPEIDVVTVQELHPEIAEKMTKDASVIFIDAALGTDQVQIARLHPSSAVEFENTHSFSPQALVNACQALYQTALLNTYLIQIPAFDISFSENLSAKTFEKSVECIDIVKNLLSQ